jgi:hypothetical protein
MTKHWRSGIEMAGEVPGELLRTIAEFMYFGSLASRRYLVRRGLAQFALPHAHTLVTVRRSGTSLYQRGYSLRMIYRDSS